MIRSELQQALVVESAYLNGPMPKGTAAARARKPSFRFGLQAELDMFYRIYVRRRGIEQIGSFPNRGMLSRLECRVVRGRAM